MAVWMGSVAKKPKATIIRFNIIQKRFTCSAKNSGIFKALLICMPGVIWLEKLSVEILTIG